MKKLLLSIRTLARFKTYTFINLLGLVFSISCALIIIRYIHQENHVNHFCPELERTFLTTVVYKEKGSIMLGSSEDRNNDPNYKNPLNDPCVEMFSRFMLYDEDYIVAENHRFEVQTVVVDSLFLTMMPYPLVVGSLKMSSPNNAIITKQLAKRLYKDKNPIGESLQVSCGKNVTIVGIVGEPATKSFLQFDLILSTELQSQWNRVSLELVRLHKADDITRLNQRNSEPMNLMLSMQMPIYYQLIPFKDFYMNMTVPTGYFKMISKGNASSLKILTFVAIMLLLVGGFNYVNLNTVIMLKRSREFGMKKVFGAKGGEVFLQLYFENFCLSGVALLCTWTIIETTRGIVDHWLEIPVVPDMQFDLMVSFVLLFILPLVISIFPFLRYRYVVVIQSLRSIGQRGHSTVVRMVFLLLQYIITISLIIAAIYFSRQLYYILHCDLGYNTKDIIQCTMISEDVTNRTFHSEEEWEAYRKEEEATNGLVKERLDESPLFNNWTVGEVPSNVSFFPSKCTASTGEKCEFLIKFVDQRYMELFGFKLQEGRLWDNEADHFQQYKFIINEAAKKALHIEDINEATIQPANRLWFTQNVDMNSNPSYEIVGVIKDFKINHLSQPDSPVAFCFSGIGRVSHLLASIVPGKRQEAIAYLEKLFHEINGEGEFNYSFVEDDIAARYHDDRRSVHIYTTFAIIAILISCLGLFGLSLYDIQQRRREIALRKVNGASAHDIFSLLLRKYCYILCLAFVIASGISYIGIQKYMESFYYHAPLSLWIFLLSALTVTLTSLCTIGWQISKAMKINPVEAIKNE